VGSRAVSRAPIARGLAAPRRWRAAGDVPMTTDAAITRAARHHPISYPMGRGRKVWCAGRPRNGCRSALAYGSSRHCRRACGCEARSRRVVVAQKLCLGPSSFAGCCRQPGPRATRRWAPSLRHQGRARDHGRTTAALAAPPFRRSPRVGHWEPMCANLVVLGGNQEKDARYGNAFSLQLRPPRRCLIVAHALLISPNGIMQ